MAKYLRKAITAKAAAMTDGDGSLPSTAPKAKAAVSATTSNVPPQDSKGQADLLAKLMAQVEAQKQELEVLKLSF